MKSEGNNLVGKDTTTEKPIFVSPERKRITLNLVYKKELREFACMRQLDVVEAGHFSPLGAEMEVERVHINRVLVRVGRNKVIVR